MRGVNQRELAAALSLSSRQVRNLTDSGVFVRKHDGNALVYDLSECVQAYMAHKKESEKPEAEDQLKVLRERKLRAEVRAAEIEVDEAEGRLIPLGVHEARIGAICDRLRSLLMTVPSKYLARIQTARTELEAQAVGEQIRDETLRALQGTSNQVDEEDVQGEVDAAEDEVA